MLDPEAIKGLDGDRRVTVVYVEGGTFDFGKPVTTAWPLYIPPPVPSDWSAQDNCLLRQGAD